MSIQIKPKSRVSVCLGFVLPAGRTAGVGEWANPGPACPTCRDKPCCVVSARSWLACFLGITLLLGAFAFLSCASLSPFPSTSLFIHPTDIYYWEESSVLRNSAEAPKHSGAYKSPTGEIFKKQREIPELANSSCLKVRRSQRCLGPHSPIWAASVWLPL